MTSRPLKLLKFIQVRSHWLLKILQRSTQIVVGGFQASSLEPQHHRRLPPVLRGNPPHTNWKLQKLFQIWMKSQTTIGFKCNQTFSKACTYLYFIRRGESTFKFYHRSMFCFNFLKLHAIFWLQNFLCFRLYALYNSIDEFTSVTSNHQRIPGNMTIGMMCLAKDEAKGFAEYNRAKVLAIECYPEGGIMVTIFFVDLGASSVLPMNELLAIPEYLIEKEPFQVRDFGSKRNVLFNNCSVRF